METKKNILSAGYLKKLEDELAMRREKRNVEIPRKIKEAREQGDVSENAEYDAAMDEQRENEARIEEIEHLLKNAEIITDDEIDVKKVGVGCTVKLQEVSSKSEIIYKIVGNIEADSLNGMISNESPVGKALIGAKKGATVEVQVPAGAFKYKVMSIEKTV